MIMLAAMVCTLAELAAGTYLICHDHEVIGCILLLSATCTPLTKLAKASRNGVKP